MESYFFEFKKLDKPKTTVIRGNGYFDEKAGERLKDAVSRYLELGETCFLFNFAGTPVINSSGLAVLMQVIDDATTKPKVEIHFCNLAKTLQDVFRMTGIANLYPVHETEEKALAFLRTGNG